MSEIDHKLTHQIVCPHCGYSDSDSYEYIQWGEDQDDIPF